MAGKSFIFRFADVEVLEREFALVRAGQTATVEPKAFRVLLILLRNPKKLISKEELLSAVWGDATVTENSLTRAIALLRRLLGDDAREPQFIETVTTVGYRWICPVEQREDSAAVSVAPDPDPDTVASAASPAGESVPARPRQGRISMGIGLGAAMIVLAGAAWYMLRPLPPPRITAYNQLTHDGHQKSLAGIDGSRVYFDVWSGNVIAQVSATGGEVSQIPVPVSGGVVGAIDVSKDGSSFLVGSGNNGFDQLWSVRILGGSVLNLGHFSRAAAFSPDGNWVAYAIENDGIYVMRANGTESRKVTAYPETAPDSLSWSPDGRAIQFELGGKFWEVAASGEGLHPFFGKWQAPGRVCCGHWTADGKFFLFIIADQIWALDERHRLLGVSPVKPVQLTSPPVQWGYLVSGKDAAKMFAVGSTKRGELTRYDPPKKVFSSFLGGISAEFLDYSHDGKSIVYVSFPDGILWKANRDGSSPVQLTEAGYYPMTPRWSPDGTQVSFTSEYPDKSAGYVVSAEGGSPRRILPAGVQAELNWSPDGKKILYIHFGDTPEEQNLSILNLDNGRVEVVPGSTGFWSPRWSRDGRYIAATSPKPSALRIFDLQTQQWRVLPLKGDADWPSFSGDGQSLFYFKRSGRVFGIYRVPLSGGQAQLVVDLSDWHITGKFGFWVGLDDSDSPLLLRDIGSSDIYALTLAAK